MLKTIVSQIKFILKLLFITFVTAPYELVKSVFEKEPTKVRICVTILAIIYLAAEVCAIFLLWGLVTKVVF